MVVMNQKASASTRDQLQNKLSYLYVPMAYYAIEYNNIQPFTTKEQTRCGVWLFSKFWRWPIANIIHITFKYC